MTHHHAQFSPWLLRAKHVSAALISSVASHAHAQWSIETVDSAGSVGRYTSLALDAGGYPHIAYHDGSNYSLKHAWLDDSGFWQIETVDDYADDTRLGRYNAMCIDTCGRIHILYQDQTNLNLKHAQKNPDEDWQVYTVGTTDWAQNTAHYVSVATWRLWGSDLDIEPDNDTEDWLEVSYYNTTDGNLMHATCNVHDDHDPDTDDATDEANSWANRGTVVDSTGDVGKYSSIAANSDGDIYISYYDETNARLKMAYNSPDMAWYFRIVVDDPAAAMVGKYTSITLSDEGVPHIAYYDQTNTALKHAVADGGMFGVALWDKLTLDSGGTVGTYTSIDCIGNFVDISYYDTTNQALKHAWRNSGMLLVEGDNGWRTEFVDNSTTWVGLDSSIKRDVDNSLWVSYHAGGVGTWSNGDLRVASK